MSLDFYIEARETEARECPPCDCGHAHSREVRPVLFDANCTHNLGGMFHEAGVYEILWYGDGRVAGSVVDRLEAAHRLMVDDPDRFKAHNPKNGWGDYDGAVGFLAMVIRACREHPEGVIRCSR